MLVNRKNKHFRVQSFFSFFFFVVKWPQTSSASPLLNPAFHIKGGVPYIRFLSLEVRPHRLSLLIYSKLIAFQFGYTQFIDLKL